MNYEKYLNPTIMAVPPSGIRKFFDLAQSMPDCISLGVGEPDFVTPYHIRDAAISCILDGQTQYTPNRGLLALRKEIAYYLASRYQTEYSPEKEILVTVGASEGIDISLRVLLKQGDEVLVPEPSYVSYSPAVRFAGGVAVPVKTTAETDFRVTAEAIEAACTAKTKALILPYPNNPTGAIMDKTTLLEIAKLAKKRDLIVISDEIYSELTYGETEHTSFAALPDMWERTLTINGFSKAFAMTGWRVGYICGPKPVVDEMVKMHQYSILCASMQGQVAAIEALKRGRENGYEDVMIMKQSYDRRRRVMLDGFLKMGLTCFEPLGAFYVFPSIKSTGLSSDDFCMSLIREKQVACVPGTAFGASGEGHIRCCYATAMDKLTTALDRMDEFIQKRV